MLLRTSLHLVGPRMQDLELIGAVGIQNQKLFPGLMEGFWNPFVKTGLKYHAASFLMAPCTLSPHCLNPSPLVPPALCCQSNSRDTGQGYCGRATSEAPARPLPGPCYAPQALFAGNVLTFKPRKVPIPNTANRPPLNPFPNRLHMLLCVAESLKNSFLCVRAKDGA